MRMYNRYYNKETLKKFRDFLKIMKFRKKKEKIRNVYKNTSTQEHYKKIYNELMIVGKTLKIKNTKKKKKNVPGKFSNDANV